MAETKSEKTDSIRVNVDILDNLMDQVGELVLVRNQVAQVDIKTITTNEFNNLSQRLSIVTSEVQNEIMRTRMQPVGRVLSKFTRLIRDVSNDLGKKIELEMHGTETELDKSLVEAIKDPLTHILRNACDHGLETPDERKAAGKEDTGKIVIKAYHEGGQVIIAIQDNGRGLNRAKILEKAISKGVVTEDSAPNMSDRDVHMLIFHPGFSTAEKVSNLSGRGVGMDVVRSNIEQIGGSVELHSIFGTGTTIKLRIPLTLAILPALIVKSDSNRLAIPQVKLVELLRLEPKPDGSYDQIEDLQGQPVCRLRGDLLPLLELKKVLNNKPSSIKDLSGVQNIAVLRAEQSLFGLIVEEIHDSSDIVVKPLVGFMKAIKLYSGATVMGDGEIALILEVSGIASEIYLDNMKGNNLSSATKKTENSSQTVNEFLTFDIGQHNHYALQLSQVNRLEEFDKSRIEQSSTGDIIQYRGSLMQLVDLVKELGLTPGSTQKPQEDPKIHVVVVEYQGVVFGIQVKLIVDVLQTREKIDIKLRDRRGLMGNLVVNGETLVVVDIIDLIEQSKIFKMLINNKNKEAS